MISVGSRDGRKGIGLGFVVGEDMEETELEEGEACSDHNLDDDSVIDPDTALSYIDEKIQDVLGHFQKDFEGGVSAENLGAKFGGYGSFLPTHQRSPTWSHPKSSPKVQNSSMLKSPSNSHSEGGLDNFVDSSNASGPIRLAPASVSFPPLPTSRVPLVNGSAKQDVCMLSTRAEDSTPKSAVGNKSAKTSDQKILRVRIKMGSDSDNLLTRKNAEIYSGLGLDVSPSSSFDGSPTDSEGLSCEPLYAPEVSPTSILQIMTSPPVNGSLLLSPLADDLICLTEKEWFWGESRFVPPHIAGQESHVMLVNGSDPLKVNSKVFGEKKSKSHEESTYKLELKNSSSKDTRHGIAAMFKKETDIDTLACEELVSDTLRLPLLSNCDVAESIKVHRKPVDASGLAIEGEDTFSSDLAKEVPLESVISLEVHCDKPNENVGPTIKVAESKKAIPPEDGVSVHPRAERFKASNNDIPAKVDLNLSKGNGSLDTELVDSSKQKAFPEVTALAETVRNSAKDRSSSGGKRKSKGSHSHVEGSEVSKDASRNDRPSSSKSKKVNTSNTEDFQKNCGKATDRYEEFFGDLGLVQGENGMASEEIPSVGRLRDPEIVENSTCEFNSTSKDIRSGQKIDKPSALGAYPGVGSTVPPPGNGSSSDVASATIPFVDDWVCCDKCQKWRLLPLGANPDSLPEKWLCSMLNWLPGMNRCSVSEEETRNALLAHYQLPASASAPASENQSMYHGHHNGVLLGVTSNGARFDQRDHNDHLNIVAASGKKKQISKDLPHPGSQDSPARFFNSARRNLQTSVKSRSLNGVNLSPLVNGIENHQLGQPTSLVLENNRHKQKEKNKLLDPDGGDSKNSKIRNRKETDEDFITASKKMKRDAMHHSDEDRTSYHSGTVLKEGRSSSSGLLVHLSGKEQRKSKDHASGSKYDSKEKFAPNLESRIQFTSDNGSKNVGNCMDKDAVVNKRRGDEQQSAGMYAETHPRSVHHVQDNREFVEETNESDHRKEKKARLSKSEGKEITAIKSLDGTVRRDRRMDLQVGPIGGNHLSLRSLDVLDSSKQDFGSAHPPVATTSSSSKVSGSRRKKTNLQELKGSPVESVSSSPMRNSNPDKFMSNRGRNYDFQDAGNFDTASARRCSDAEDDEGSNQAGARQQDETCAIVNRGSLESSVLDFEDSELGNVSGDKAKKRAVSSPEFSARVVIDGDDAESFGEPAQVICEPRLVDQCHDKEKGNLEFHPNGPRQRKSGKASQSKEKFQGCRSEFDKGKAKSADIFNDSIDHASYGEKVKAGRTNLQEDFGNTVDKGEKNVVSKKDASGKLLSENCERESISKFGAHDGSDIRVNAVSSQDLNMNLLLDHDVEKSSKRLPSEKTDRVEVSGSEKLHSLPPSGRGQNEKVMHCPQPNSRSLKEKGADVLLADASGGEDSLKALKSNKKPECQNGNQAMNSRHSTANVHKIRDLNAPSPIRRDSCSQVATNAVKEAKDLKHLADRLKNSGSIPESTGLYFQAALKFLHGSCLLESCNSENTKQGEMIQSRQMYSSTAKLCEFCAHEYEKSKDMASAALAYKCMEVAYMRVIYASHNRASGDRHELQTALQILPPGESPSSSASDVDNLNNPATVDKVASTKESSSPQVAGNHAITARNRSSFLRILNFTQDVNFAMEASRKSRIAFAAASPRLGGAQCREGISSVKRALDFSFQDVEGLLRLVRLAMEAISR